MRFFFVGSFAKPDNIFVLMRITSITSIDRGGVEGSDGVLPNGDATNGLAIRDERGDPTSPPACTLTVCWFSRWSLRASALRRAASLEDLKFPHDYYDRSARVEEETKRFAGGAGGAARRCVALEMEDDTDESDADEGGDLPGHRDH